MNEDEARVTAVATLSRLALTETDFGPAGATIVRRAPPPPVDARTLPSISVAQRNDALSDGVDLRVHTLLGKGGMGVVQAAEQRALLRDVAVKTVSGEDARLRHALVRE